MKLQEIDGNPHKVTVIGKIRRIFHSSHARHDMRFLWLGALVGLIAGVVAIVFREAIEGMTILLFGGQPEQDFLEVLKSVPLWKIIIIPPLVGAFVSWFTARFASEAKGHGVPEIMDAIVTKRGYIRPRVTLIKLIASACSIASGFSVGREGPTALIGATIGSLFGQMLRFPVVKMKMIVGCGAAAGIAATFNAPLAGTAFALELIVGAFNVRYLVPIIIAAMMATVVTHNHYGAFHELFSTVHFDIKHLAEIIPYAFLGVLMGFAGILFTRLLYSTEELVDRIEIPEWVKGLIGGAGVSAFLWAFPGIAGPANWSSIHSTLTSDISWYLIGSFLGLAVLKALATSFCLAFGASGGVFAPSLLMGGALGASYGVVISRIFPAYSVSPAGYALVGMGSFIAGVTQAPLTAIAIIFEMTNNMTVMLPLIVSGSIALAVYNHFLEGSIYTLKLKKRGLTIEWGRETGVLQNIMVSKAYANEDEVFHNETPINEVLQQFASSTRSTLPVINSEGHLLGIVSHWDIRRKVEEGAAKESSIEQHMKQGVMCVHPQQSLYEAFLIISTGDFDYLPVVESPNSRLLVGRLSRHKVLQIYKSELISRGVVEEEQLHETN